MMSLGSLILFIFNFFIQNPILDKAADFWPIFWIVVLFIAVIKWGRSSRKLRSMMAQKICIDDVLNQYLQVEIFDPECAVDNKILNAAGIYSMGTGNNYMMLRSKPQFSKIAGALLCQN